MSLISLLISGTLLCHWQGTGGRQALTARASEQFCTTIFAANFGAATAGKGRAGLPGARRRLSPASPTFGLSPLDLPPTSFLSPLQGKADKGEEAGAGGQGFLGRSGQVFWQSCNLADSRCPACFNLQLQGKAGEGEETGAGGEGFLGRGGDGFDLDADLGSEVETVGTASPVSDFQALLGSVNCTARAHGHTTCHVLSWRILNIRSAVQRALENPDTLTHTLSSRV